MSSPRCGLGGRSQGADEHVRERLLLGSPPRGGGAADRASAGGDAGFSALSGGPGESATFRGLSRRPAYKADELAGVFRGRTTKNRSGGGPRRSQPRRASM